MIQSEQYWCCAWVRSASGGDGFVIGEIHRTRSECWDAWFRIHIGWVPPSDDQRAVQRRFLYRKGCRVVRVNVTPIDGDGEEAGE